MLQQRALHVAAGAAVFGASAFLGFQYKIRSAPPPKEEALPTEAERRHIFYTKAEGWDREVAFQELLLGIGRLRKELVRQAQGDVLEVAAGTGRNFRYYDKERVRSLTVTDFCSSMLRQAKTKKDEVGDISISFCLANASKLPSNLKQYNTVVQTFALCSYEDPVKTLKALGDVLLPGGALLLLEHGMSSFSLLNFILNWGCNHHVRQFGCFANRDILHIVQQAGFEVVSLKRRNFGTTYMIVAKKKDSERQRGKSK